MRQQKIRAVYMRGGTSKGVFFRAEDLPTSSAHVIEAVRLAEALATLRGRPLAGLAEVTDATRAVLCDGDEVVIGAVMQHVEEAGIHSGDSACVIPAMSLGPDMERQVEEAASKLALRLGVIGHIDSQRMIADLAETAEELALRPAPKLEDAATFTPATDIAAMRHEIAEHRLFAN